MGAIIGGDDEHRCRRCGSEISLAETSVVEGDEHSEGEMVMRVSLVCSPSCYEMGFPLGPLIDPDGVRISETGPPDFWLPE